MLNYSTQGVKIQYLLV